MLKTSPTTSELKKRKDKANGSFVWSRITWLTWCCNRIPRVFFNIFTPSVTRLFGYQIEELLGKSAFDFLHPDERSVAINAFPDTLKKGQGVVEAPLLHKDGHYIRMDIIAKTFYTEKG